MNLDAMRSSRLRRLSCEGMWIVGGQTLAVLGSLLGLRLLTELLDASAYGQLALGMTAATLVNQTIFGPLTNGVARFYAPAAEKGDLGSYLEVVYSLSVRATALVLTVTLVAAAACFASNNVGWIWLAAAAFAFAAVTGCNSVLTGIQNAARQRSTVAFHQGMEPWIRFTIAGSLLWGVAPTSAVAMSGYCIAAGVVLGSQYLRLSRLIPTGAGGSKNAGAEWRTGILTFSTPFAVWGVFTWAQVSSDRWSLELFASTREVGLYAVVYQVGYYPISLATTITMQFLAPILYQRAGDGTDIHRRSRIGGTTWRLFALTFALTASAFVTALAAHREIFRIFVSSEYGAVSYLLPWAVLASGVFAAGQILGLRIMSEMEAGRMVAVKIGTALLGLVSNVLGAYYYGTRGILAAGVLFSSSYVIWMVALATRRRR